MAPSLNHLESVLWLPMGPRETGGYVSCSLESVKAAVQCHRSGGAGQCLGEELGTHLSNIPP